MAVGQGVRDALVRFEGLPPGRIEVIYNGIDLDRYPEAPDEAARREVRREFGVADGTLLAVIVARLDPIKDHAHRGAGDRPAAAGGNRRAAAGHRGGTGTGCDRGGKSNGPERRARVTLAGLRRDVPRLLAAADVGLLTSVSEGIPLTVIEAMAARRPVVATDVGGLREVVCDDTGRGDTGLLVPVGDDAAVAAALARLAADAPLRRRLGEAGRRVAVERFGEPAMADAYAGLYEAPAPPRRGHPALKPPRDRPHNRLHIAPAPVPVPLPP